MSREGRATDAGVSLAAFGAMAGGAFLLGAVLLWAFDRRALWFLGAAFQLFAIIAYIDVGSQRTPAFEPWGISLEVAQALLLTMLLFLAVTPNERLLLARRRARGRS